VKPLFLLVIFKVNMLIYHSLPEGKSHPVGNMVTSQHIAAAQPQRTAMCWFGFTGGGGMPTPAGAGRRFRASQGLLWKAAGKSHDFAGIFPELPGILTNLKSIRQRPLDFYIKNW
jgi:hypothetical protein